MPEQREVPGSMKNAESVDLPTECMNWKRRRGGKSMTGGCAEMFSSISDPRLFLLQVAGRRYLWQLRERSILKNSVLTQNKGEKKVYRLRKRDRKRYHRTNMQDVREDVLYFKAGLCVQLGGRNSDASHSVWPQASVSMWTSLCSNSVRSAPVLQRIAVSGWRRWVGENIFLCLKYVWDTPVQALWMEPKWNFSLS